MIPSDFRGKVLVNEPLSNWTSIGTGGKADFLVFPEDADELLKLVCTLENSGVRWFVMGLGSNVLFPDSGFRGVVIKTDNLNNMVIEKNLVKVEAGVRLEALLRKAAEKGLGGLEGLTGIPGSVGGAVRMNAGAYGYEIGPHIKDVLCVVEGELKSMEYRYNYRFSSVMDMVVVETVVEFEERERNKILEEMEDFRNRRKKTQPLDRKTFGSVFKNPEGKKAWELLLEAGLPGTRIGGAMFSRKHANFIENTGNARTEDVIELINLAKEKVYEKTGIKLEEEVVIVKEED